MGLDEQSARHAAIDRRSFVRRAGLAALAAGGIGPLLAACGDPRRPGPEVVPAADGVSAPPPLPPFDPEQPYWMQGGFAPVSDEVEAFDLPVLGALPPELVGTYVRNGSNPAAGASSHWFLGDGMVHGVHLERGWAIWYRNRYVDTPLVQEGTGLLGGGPPGGARNQSNVSVVAHGGRLLSLGELGLPYELSPSDLSTVGPFDYAGRLTTSMTAHPKVHPATGDLHLFGYGFVPPYLSYHVADRTGRLVHSTEIAVSGPTMVHDFAITDRDVVFWELPVVFDMEIALASVRGERGRGMPFRWDESYGARVGVLPLGADGAAIRWVDIPPCYVFHGVNAFREGDDVVLDVCRMPSMFAEGGGVGSAVVHRWRLGTGGGDLTFRDEAAADESWDLPSIDRRRTGLPNRHAWYLLVEPEDGWPAEFPGLVHVDGATGSVSRYAPGPGERVNEATFVPAEAGAPEGEGWLLSFAWNRVRGASDLLVLDAQAVAEGPVARVELPVRVPYGFHGAWLGEPAA